MNRPTILKVHPQATVATASVSAASNFFATAITFTAVGDIMAGRSGRLWVTYASVTTALLELILDDGSGSVTMSLVPRSASTTYISTGVFYNFDVPVDPRWSYNFSPALGGTAILCDVYFVEEA